MQLIKQILDTFNQQILERSKGSTVFTVFEQTGLSKDPDETLQSATSHQGLQCLPHIQQFLDTTSGSKLYLFKF